MAIALDGFGTLRKIGEQREVFAPARIEVDKAARAIVAKCLKARTLDLTGLRAMRNALGEDTLALVAYDLKAGETSALLKRIDKHFAGLKTATQDESTRRLLALARGEAEAAPSPEGAAKPSKDRAPKRLESALMKAFAKGGRQDDQD